VLDRVGQAVTDRSPLLVAYANVHVINEARRDDTLREFLDAADVVYPDGAGVVLGARWLGNDLGARMTGADWIVDFAARAAAEGWRVGWIGGEYGVAAEAVRVLQARFPGLRVPLVRHGWPRGEEGERQLDRDVTDARLDVLLVGMGTPAQERWVANRRDRLRVPVIWCIGAVADFVSGRTPRGPRWLHQRQEWLARLIIEPRRLWRRYLVGNPRFLWAVLRQGRRG
jgi:N-acetylglucosaminyldiphosphoundecaprenol N-acetyl-beta-D-mannosaminyltransferase